ncbi:MAG: glycosyltransferase family 2 protein [Anaerolineae bacterium]|nr:glycosyltransferase family 2 protein [Anaerolineae bacterium]
MSGDLLGIVTVSYNVREHLRRCLASVQETLRAGGLTAEIVVVDNASSDGSAAMLRDEFPWVRLVANERNVGFAAGSNQGLRSLGFPGPDGPRYAMLLNPDTIVRERALAEMTSFLERNGRAGAAGARLVYEDGAFQHSAFHYPTLAMAFLDFFVLHHRLLDTCLNGRYPRRLYQAGEPFEVDHPLGATLTVRREAAAQVGLLDERFFMYCEEIDWCRRIKRAGWHIYCVPRAEVVHLEARSSRQFREEMFVALWRSRYQLFAKHNGPLYRWAVRRIVSLGVRREMGRVRRDLRRGKLSAETAERRLAAYARVLELGSGTP